MHLPFWWLIPLLAFLGHLITLCFLPKAEPARGDWAFPDFEPLVLAVVSLAGWAVLAVLALCAYLAFIA